MFGWKHASTGYRRFRKVFLFVPKGNGKSPLGAGVGLYLALCDNEPAAEVYAVATDKDQAKIVHESAKVMVEESADLSGLCQVLRDSIFCPAGRSYYKAVSADSAGKHGFRPHGVIFDELHAQPDRKLFEAFERSFAKRRQPLLLLMTHAGDDDEGICYEEYEYAKRVLEGTAVDPTYFPMIFEAAPEDDWTSPATWAKANPMLGITVQEEALEAGSRAALLEPRKLNDFLRYHLNRWVGTAVAWIPVDWWDNCRGELVDDVLVGLDCAAGLDMAQKIDFAALTVTWREFLEDVEELVVAVPVDAPEQERGRRALSIDSAELESLEAAERRRLAELELEAALGPGGLGGDAGAAPDVRTLRLNFRVYSRTWYWIPEATARERIKQGLPLVSWRDWNGGGYLTITEGASIDYNRVYQDITGKIVPRYPRLRGAQIGYDPAFATDIASRLRDDFGLTVVEVLQNYKYMSEPAHVFEALVKAGRWRQDGNPIMRWNVENVAVKRDDSGRIRPVKPKRATKRIDGVVGGLMGLSRLIVQPEGDGAGSGYDSSGGAIDSW